MKCKPRFLVFEPQTPEGLGLLSMVRLRAMWAGTTSTKTTWTTMTSGWGSGFLDSWFRRPQGGPLTATADKRASSAPSTPPVPHAPHPIPAVRSIYVSFGPWTPAGFTGICRKGQGPSRFCTPTSLRRNRQTSAPWNASSRHPIYESCHT